MCRTRHYTELTFSLLNIPDDSVPAAAPSCCLRNWRCPTPHAGVQYMKSVWTACVRLSVPSFLAALWWEESQLQRFEYCMRPLYLASRGDAALRHARAANQFCSLKPQPLFLSTIHTFLSDSTIEGPTCFLKVGSSLNSVDIYWNIASSREGGPSVDVSIIHLIKESVTTYYTGST